MSSISMTLSLGLPLADGVLAAMTETERRKNKIEMLTFFIGDGLIWGAVMMVYKSKIVSFAKVSE